MAKQDDGLFLLEVLIDKIVFVKSPCFSDKDFRTCVNIECPAVEPLEICDDDPGACVAKSGGPFVKTFNNGKSCLFSLKESDISKAMSKFPIKVSVYKSLPCGCLPTKVIMGEATIDMTKEFVQARKKFLEDPSVVSYQALKDSFRIVGPDNTETGEIVMFLRISCFGKLIITRFQGGGAPNLSAGAGPGIVDRSCNPRREFQTTQDPCVCGAARGGTSGGGGMGQPCPAGSGGAGVCPIARDPYNSMPCQDPDDPCYCSGPKPAPNQQMACRNTDQYCLHVPKGGLQTLPIYQDLNEDQKQEIKKAIVEVKQLHANKYLNVMNKSSTQHSQASSEIDNNFIEKTRLISKLKAANQLSSDYSLTSLCTIRSKRRSVSFSNTVDYVSKSRRSFNGPLKDEDSKENSLFGGKETTVYMTLFNDYCRHRTSGTQATASLNKCLQVYQNTNKDGYYTSNTDSTNCSSYTMSNCPYNPIKRGVQESVRYPEVYFFGRKKEEPKPEEKGMGSSGSKSKLKRSGKVTAAPVRSDNPKAASNSSLQGQSQSSTGVQTTRARGASTATSTAKSVCIKEEKCEKPCPAACATKGDMMATVSHIKIGPREPCPVHGTEPCQGPKCIVAISGQSHAPVKVTTAANPRRGVFELVVRRMTGAPLAKNELMLEWTPPPCRPPPCGSPCGTPCSPTPCLRPSKCKMIVCRPSPCKPKCCKKPCKKPCGPMPCRPVPCKKCCRSSCCGKPCRPCKPCPPPPKCKPCPPSPCKSPCIPPCCKSSCSSPCKSSPCLRPCPVGYRRPRRARSQPRIRPHPKRVSPCCNRTKLCPVVRCRSVPGPCLACCMIPRCPPRKCCSISPCRPPKCCKSSCSTCCV